MIETACSPKSEPADQPLQYLGLTRIPRNVRAVGVLLDREHVSDVARLGQFTPNERANALWAGWRHSLEHFPFCVIAGRLHRRDGETVGGLAHNWRRALELFCYANHRLDTVATAEGADFVTVWQYHVTDERVRQLSAIVAAAAQPVCGNA